MSFEELKQFAIIKVLGVGGGGGNAVNRMVVSDLKGVEFWAINTDLQALNVSLAPNKLQLGAKLTKGLGGGAKPEIGESSAEESYDDLVASIRGADMVFLTAGMGGGTGTGATPMIAKAAKEAGALTIAVVTKPFRFEGPRRARQAQHGLDKLRKEVDALIVVPNDKLLKIADHKTNLVDAFKLVDDVLLKGVKGIADLITIPGLVNLDFADVKTIMLNSGSAMMGIGIAGGENRASEAAEKAISSVLLEESIHGATGVIINVTGGPNLTLLEVNEAAEIIYNAVDSNNPEINIIFGSVINPDLKDDIEVTVIATGFNPQEDLVANRSIESKQYTKASEIDNGVQKEPFKDDRNIHKHYIKAKEVNPSEDFNSDFSINNVELTQSKPSESQSRVNPAPTPESSSKLSPQLDALEKDLEEDVKFGLPSFLKNLPKRH